MAKTSPKVDIFIEGGARAQTVYRFIVCTKAARAWVDANVALEGWQWLGNGFGVDHRYAVDLADAMAAAGLVVK